MFLYIALCTLFVAPLSFSQLIGTVSVNVQQNIDSLLADEDTDHDRRLTIDDPRIDGTTHGDKKFWLVTTDGRRFGVEGTLALSNLLQELSLAREAGQRTAILQAGRIFEQPVDRISRLIREVYWDGLTRHIDERGLPKIFADEKTTTVDGRHYVFVPHADSAAENYFLAVAARHPEWKMEVVRLPEQITPSYVRSLDGYHGILTLGLRKGSRGEVEGIPFVVPGGRFNEMYGWDSYFITLGLLDDRRIDMARAMVDNFVYEIDYYGAILNANRTYYLTRSQPPFLTSMAVAVHKQLPKTAERKTWLKEVLHAAIAEYTTVWMGPLRLTATGLSRYADAGSGPPPEAGPFDDVYAMYAARAGMSIPQYAEAYTTGRIKEPDLDRYFAHDRAMRESGHDTSYRLVGRAADLVTVDLNSLLYKTETDIGLLIANEFGGTLRFDDGTTQRSADWEARAEKRKELMNAYLWDPGRGMFSDYDVVRKERTGYVSATVLYPLWAGLASRDQGASLVTAALPLLEMPGGIVGSSKEARGPLSAERPARQWDYPYGWSPHQILSWQGFMNYGYGDIARRLAYRWLYTITANAAHFNGTVPEKFDVVERTHEVFAEYGNVGTRFSYITREGFGWTNASYQLGLRLLSADRRALLNRFVPPEWIFDVSREQ